MQWTAACPLVLVVLRTVAPVSWGSLLEQSAWIAVSCACMIPTVIHDDVLG